MEFLSGFERLTLSMKMIPGSAQRCVDEMMRFHMSGAKTMPGRGGCWPL
jgi:hypothetical protein